MSKIMVKEQRETMSLLFFIKKTKLLKNGEAPICLRYAYLLIDKLQRLELNVVFLLRNGIKQKDVQ